MGGAPCFHRFRVPFVEYIRYREDREEKSPLTRGMNTHTSYTHSLASIIWKAAANWGERGTMYVTVPGIRCRRGHSTFAFIATLVLCL